MNNWEFLDLCREVGATTVDYSSNPKTIERWLNEGKEVVMCDGYDYVFYEHIPEQWAEFDNGRLTFASLPEADIPLDVFLMAGYLEGVNKIRFYYANDKHLPYGFRIIDIE